MEISTFFARFLQPAKDEASTALLDDIEIFDANWLAIRDTLLQPDERQLSRGIQSTDVPARLSALVDALVYESNRNDEDTTGACLEYFLKNNVLDQLGKLCEPDRPRGIKTEVVKAIHNMVVLLSEHFLVHNAIHRPLRRLLRSCIGDDPEERIDGSARIMGAAAAASDDDARTGAVELELELVDLMCILCSRMRSFPPLLLIFFHDRSWAAANPNALSERPTSPSPSAANTTTSNTSKRPHRFEFLLFSYLLRFVHRESRIGDFARAGLLFLFDIAFLPDPDLALQAAKSSLAEYVLDGDTCDVIAASLGAVYSVLPTKLRVPSVAAAVEEGEGVDGGMQLGAAVPHEDDETIPLSTDASVQTQLDLLLKLLGFVYDMLTRSTSSSDISDIITPATLLGAAITESTLASIESSFLSGILYPSILESSPRDSSAVAVITYLHVIITHLPNGVLLESMLRFLLGLDSSGRATSTNNRKKSSAMILLQRERRAPRSHPEYFTADGRFTLRDLVLDNLRSGGGEASTAALGLCQGLLSNHCALSVEGLLVPLKVEAGTALPRFGMGERLLVLDDEPGSPDSEAFVYPGSEDGSEASPFSLSPSRQIPSKRHERHQQEMNLYFSLLHSLDSSSDPQTAPQAYMTDVLHTLRDISCFHQADDNTESRQHRLSPSDPVLRMVLRHMADFFAHEPDENLALTGVASTLALCPVRSLVGWMVCEDDEEHKVDWKATVLASGGGDDESLGGELEIAEPLPPIKPKDYPALYQVLLHLTTQVDTFRDRVPSFDRYLSERRRGLLFAVHLDDAMNVLLEINATTFPEPAPKRPALPKARSSMASSLRSFLTPKKKSDPPMGTPGTPEGTPARREEGGSPFQQHYSQTKAISLNHRPGTGVEHGPWSPARRNVPNDPFVNQSDGEDDDEAEAELIQRKTTSTVTLSSVLDHCVILEEFIKELTSILVARRVCGIDQVSYL